MYMFFLFIPAAQHITILLPMQRHHPCPEEEWEKPCIPENKVVYSPKVALNGKIADAGISEKGALAASAPVHGLLGSPGSCGVTADGLTPSSVKGNVFFFPAECVFRPAGGEYGW
ncbi:MAG: hypothetical protein IKX47_00780 [Oscillospiraceae bacterium]|nr:hypothetical protein [Oscillospiraceae bacterium]